MAEASADRVLGGGGGGSGGSNVTPPVRFFCHKCNIEFEHVMQDYTCPFCAMGFIEKLEETSEENHSQSHTHRRREADDDGLRLPGGVPARGVRFQISRRRGGDNSRDVDMAVLDDSSEDTAQDSPHLVNLNDLAFLLLDAHNSSVLNNPPQSGAPPRESRLLQLVQQVVLGGEAGGPLVVLGGRGAAGGLEAALSGEYVMSGEGLDAIMSQLLWQAESEGPPPLPAQAIASLPEVTVTKEQVTQGLQCSVCWETFVIDEKVRELSCGHVYHQDCITPWLSLHATCPICRKSLAPPTPTTPPPGPPNNSEQQPNSLAFLFRACGIPTPAPTTAVTTGGTSTATTTTTASSGSSASGSPPSQAAPPPSSGRSISDLLNQLVSISETMALNFSMGRGTPTVTTSNTSSSTQPPPTATRQPPPPANYDSDMDFD